MALSDQQFNIIVGLINNTKKQTDQINSQLDEIDKNANVLGDTFNNLGGVIGTVIGIISVGAIINLGKQIISLAENGAKAQVVYKAFATNFGDFTSGMNKLNDASKGTIDQVTLAQIANQAAIHQVTNNASQLASVLQVARVIAKQTTGDTASTFQQLVNSLQTGNTKLLKSYLDISPEQLKVLNKMDSTARKQAELNLITAQASTLARKYGTDQLDTADKFAQLGVKFTNLQNQIGISLTPLFSEILDMADKFVTDNGPAIQGFIEKHLIPKTQEMVGWLKNHWPEIQAAATATFEVISIVIDHAFKGLKEFYHFLEKVSEAAKAVGDIIGESLKSYPSQLMDKANSPNASHEDKMQYSLAVLTDSQIQNYIRKGSGYGAGVSQSELTDYAQKNGIKFANGGDFIVPRGYPNDSFPMNVQSGERVQVTPASQTSNTDNSNKPTINNYFTYQVDTNTVASRLAFQLSHK